MYKKNDLNCIEETTYTLCVQGNHRNEVLATFKDKQSYETFIQLHYDNEEVKTQSFLEENPWFPNYIKWGYTGLGGTLGKDTTGLTISECFCCFLIKCH